MPQTDLDTRFLFAYKAGSESWESVRLGSSVSPLSVEAMNLILSKGGIRAYIGTREEFGHYDLTLLNKTDKVTPYSLTSCHGHTLHAVLGLRRSMGVTGSPEMDFYGSPLTVALVVCLLYQRFWPEMSISELEEYILDRSFLVPYSNHGMVRSYFLPKEEAAYYIHDQSLERFVTSIELHEALGYLDPSFG